MRRFFRPFFWFVIVFILATKTVEWTTEAWFFQEVGYFPVFRRLMLMRGALFGLGSALCALLLSLNLRHATKVAAAPHLGPVQRLIPPKDKRLLDRFRSYWAGALLIFLVILSGLYAAAHDLVVWRAVSYQETDTHDPTFGLDLAFYLLQLPALNFFWTLVFILLLVSLCLTALFYAYEDIWQTRERNPIISAAALRHLAALVVALLLWKALGYRLSAWNMLTSRGEQWGGLSFTALQFQLPLFGVLATFNLVTALILWREARLQQQAAYACGRALFCWAGANLIVGSAVPFLVQTIYTKQNRAGLEISLLEQRRDATRDAFALQNVSIINAKSDDTPDDNASTDVPLWTPDFLQKFLNSNQRRGDDFSFAAPIFDRYVINGTPRNVFVAPREGIGGAIGHGLAFCDATKISPDGFPIVYNSAQMPELQPEHAEIVFGSGQTEPSPDYTRNVPTTPPDFWRRARNTEISPYNLLPASYYSGGIDLRSLKSRILLAWNFFDRRLLSASDQKLVWHRNIIERCKQIAPFFVYGEPRPVLSKGRIWWLIPAHDVSDSYPLAYPTGNSKINYLRMGALAVVDAYDGAVQFFVWDESDWLLQAHRRLFPEIFRDFQALPQDLRAHLTPSSLQFAAQSDVWARALGPSGEDILAGDTFKFAVLRQNVLWNDAVHDSLLPTPYWQNNNLNLIQLFSPAVAKTDEKMLTTPLSGALICQLCGRNSVFQFLRLEKSLDVPRPPKKGTVILNAAINNGQILLRGAQFSPLSPPETFWFSAQIGLQNDANLLSPPAWNAIGKEAANDAQNEEKSAGKEAKAGTPKDSNR